MRVVNLAVPRTASVYIQRSLSNIVRPHGHYHLIRPCDWTHAGIQLLPEECRCEFIIGVVRNPFDLLVSTWSNLRNMDVLMHAHDRGACLDFRDWLTLVAHRRHHWPQAYPLHWQLFDDRWRLGVNYLARFETLDQDLAAVAEHTGGVFTPQPPVNASPRDGHWSTYYDEPMLRLVEEAWFADLRYFGWSRDGWNIRKAMTTFGLDPEPTRWVGPRRPDTPWEERPHNDRR